MGLRRARCERVPRRVVHPTRLRLPDHRAFVMPVRVAVSDDPPWEIAVVAAIVLGATYGLVRPGGAVKSGAPSHRRQAALPRPLGRRPPDKPPPPVLNAATGGGRDGANVGPTS